MKKIFINIGLILGLFASLTFNACKENISPIVTELDFSRTFMPLNLTAKVTLKTTATLNWAALKGVDGYVVEISENNTYSPTIFTGTIAANQVSYKVVLAGETQYFARLKAVTSGTEDSKWAEVSFLTEPENIFLALGNGDVQATTAILKWTPGSEVTHFIITPGNTQRNITAAEKTAGQATLTGLTGETAYSVVLNNNTKKRGTIGFTTLVDLAGATPVRPTDDLGTIIAAATSGTTLALFPGDYTVNQGDITISKSLTIKAVYPYNKPIIHNRFLLSSGIADFTVQDIEMVGTNNGAVSPFPQAFQFNSGTYNVNSLKIVGCTIRDFGQALIYGNNAVLKLSSLVIDNCIMSNIINTGGDFIDFRTGYVASISVTKSTFNKVAAFPRDFIRLDAAATLSGTGLTSTVTINKCTFYGVSGTAGVASRILYVRFLSNASTVSNCIFAGPTGYLGYFTNQPNTVQPVCSKNNYFNALNFYTTGSITNMKVDNSGTHTTLDPGFTNSSSGDFTISNTTLKDNLIGDPRWIK